MGIKDINNFLKDKNVSCFRIAEAHKFKGKTVVIDGGILFVKSVARIHKNLIYTLKNAAGNYDKRVFFRELMTDILKDIMFFMKHGFNPVVIFDGPKDPDKEECVEERMMKKQETRESVNVALDEYNLAMENPLEYGLPDEYEKKLKNLRSRDLPYYKENISEIYQIFETLGIPFFEAPHDAEFLCCSLILEGKADTVYTSDTDCYAFGIDYMITKINEYRGEIEITDIRRIISFFSEELNVETEVAKRSLRDFCIMCGCDFNKRVYGIGPKKSFDLLLRYKRIFNITGKDLSSLKNDICSRKFRGFETEIDVEDMQLNMGKFLSNGEEVFFQFNSQELDRSFRMIESNFIGKHA